jgi:hypothetical protein
MIASGAPGWLATVQVGAFAAVLVYDVRRARSSVIVGEAPLRRRRAATLAVALGALLLFHFVFGRDTRGWVALAVFGVACLLVVAWSLPLKRLVLADRARRASSGR